MCVPAPDEKEKWHPPENNQRIVGGSSGRNKLDCHLSGSCREFARSLSGECVGVISFAESDKILQHGQGAKA